MNSTNGIPNSLPTLDGKNLIRSKKQMQSLFGFHETLEVVTGGVLVLAADATEAQKTAHNEVKKKDCKAAYCIQTTVDSANFDRISHAESAKEAWDILVKYYEGGEKVKVVKLQTLRRQYELLSMGEDEKVAEYVSKVHKLVHLMKGCGETLTDNMIVEKALQAQSWKNNGGSNKFKGKFDKNQGKKPWSNPHKQQDEDRTSESSKGGGGNYRKDKEDKKGKGVQCYNCEKWGHMSKHCWYKKDNGSTKGKDEGAKLARQDSDDSEEGMVVMAAITDNHVESKIWFGITDEVEVEGIVENPVEVKVESDTC
ncbi:uncharacterized protein LOC131594735 [Vicia villosa]|uniref:uncharacterized protein LOC131594735 n=1 Tax=Vicia villosa TaxID=3911 RepID=UPI00273B1C8C|nr:uncharacterized protein LOC131594735 [Vicia villosa]